MRPKMADGDSTRTPNRKTRGFGDVGDAERAARWAMWRLRGMGYKRMARLIDEADGRLGDLFGSRQPVARRLCEACGFSDKLTARVLGLLDEHGALDAYADEVERLPAATRILHLGEASYPQRLLDLEDPPVFLYARGRLDWTRWQRTVAIVGSRKATVAGVRLAHKLARELGEAGVGVISGGALGVDVAAHRGCLDAGAQTVAVLAGGVERPTPRSNATVFERVVEQGALVSEYPIGVKPRPFYFQRRNRLIAAMGDATVVVRAGMQSGTMLTAHAARDLGRPLCAVPGALDAPLTAGCHQLLVDGAQCVRSAADVLEVVFGLPPRKGQISLPSAGPGEGDVTATPDVGCEQAADKASRAERRAPPETLSEDGQKVCATLFDLAGPAGDAIHRDQIERAFDWPASRLSAAMLELELAGVAHKRPGSNMYRPG